MKTAITKEQKAQFEQFKAWVEQTKLFNTIIQYSGTGARIDAFEGDGFLTFQLNSVKIRTFEELPKELLLEFYINSPWANTIDFTTLQTPLNLIENEIK